MKLQRAAAGAVTFGRVKLEVAAAATGWEARHRVAETQLCQRYLPVIRNASGAQELIGQGYIHSTALGVFIAQIGRAHV